MGTGDRMHGWREKKASVETGEDEGAGRGGTRHW